MGLYTSALIRILQTMKTNGFAGKTFCMVGKQHLTINMSHVTEVLKKMNLTPPCENWESIVRDESIVNDSVRFFSLYGLDVHALDISDYEGADILYDLREDIPEELCGQFDYVLDGGVTEHVFDPAKTISNISQLVKRGGVVIHILPAVGYVQHGFYSPTFFEDFYAANGFEIETLDLDFLFADGKWNTDNYPDHVVIQSCDMRLFPDVSGDWAKRRINDYVKSIYGLPTVGHGHLWCIARKIEMLPVTYPIQGMYAGVVKTN